MPLRVVPGERIGILIQSIRLHLLNPHKASCTATICRVWWNGFLRCETGSRADYPSIHIHSLSNLRENQPFFAPLPRMFGHFCIDWEGLVPNVSLKFINSESRKIDRIVARAHFTAIKYISSSINFIGMQPDSITINTDIIMLIYIDRRGNCNVRVRPAGAL